MLRKVNPSSVFRIPSSVRDLFSCLVSAILLILSFPTYNIWLFAWFGFVPLFIALRNKSRGRAFLLAYITGIVFWTGTIYWLIHVTLPGTILLVFYLALYFGIFGLIFSTTDHRPQTTDLFFFPSVWVLLEYVRAHLFTGFPWALLGYSQYLNLPAIQIADVTGAWGVSFLVMMMNVVIVSVVRRPSSVVRERQKYLLPLLCVLFTLIYGYYKIYGIRNTEYGIRIKISVIQPNIPQELKWDPDSPPYILEKFKQLTEEAAKAAPDLIIWPESANPGVLGEDDWTFESIAGLVRKIKAPLLFGTVAYSEGNYFNSAVLLDASGRATQRYDKLHLVPFGEYIPLKKILPFLQAVVPIGDMARGKEYVIFSDNRPQTTDYRLQTTDQRQNFSVLICFEDLFPELSREFVKRGAGFLVNITNDAWYKKTGAPYQHLQASVFRAVENRVPLARSANTGVSAFIAPSGRIISAVRDERGREIFVPGYKTEEIAVLPAARSLYTRYGDIFLCACFLFALCGIIPAIKK